MFLVVQRLARSSPKSARSVPAKHNRMEIRDRKYLLGYAGHFPVLAEKERSGKYISCHTLMSPLAILGNDTNKPWREPHPVTFSQRNLTRLRNGGRGEGKFGGILTEMGDPFTL